MASGLVPSNSTSGLFYVADVPSLEHRFSDDLFCPFTPSQFGKGVQFRLALHVGGDGIDVFNQWQEDSRKIVAKTLGLSPEETILFQSASTQFVELKNGNIQIRCNLKNPRGTPSLFQVSGKDEDQVFALNLRDSKNFPTKVPVRAKIFRSGIWVSFSDDACTKLKAWGPYYEIHTLVYLPAPKPQEEIVEERINELFPGKRLRLANSIPASFSPSTSPIISPAKKMKFNKDGSP